MLYGLNSEYGKYKKVCKSKKEQDYISWRNHILEKYIHTKASDRLNMEKYVNMKLRNAEHEKEFVIGIFIPIIVVIISIYMAVGSDIYNTEIAYNSAKNDLYTIRYRGEEKQLEQIQDKLSSGEWKSDKSDLELQKAESYIRIALLNTEQAESIKNSINETSKRTFILNFIVMLMVSVIGAAFTRLYFSYSKMIDFYTDFIEIIHNFDELVQPLFPECSRKPYGVFTEQGSACYNPSGHCSHNYE